MNVLIDAVFVLLIHGGVLWGLDRIAMESTQFIKSIWGFDFHYYKYDRQIPERFYNCNTFAVYITALFVLLPSVITIFIQIVFFMFIDTRGLVNFVSRCYLLNIVYGIRLDKKYYAVDPIVACKLLMFMAIPHMCVYMVLVDLVNAPVEDIPIRIHSVCQKLTNAEIIDQIAELVIKIKIHQEKLRHIRLGVKVVILFYVLLIDNNFSALDVYFLTFVLASEYVEGIQEPVHEQ